MSTANSSFITLGHGGRRLLRLQQVARHPLHLAGPRAAGLASRVAHRHVPVCRRSHPQYPDDLTPASLEAHIDDLLRRFANRALGDNQSIASPRSLPQTRLRRPALGPALLLRATGFPSMLLRKPSALQSHSALSMKKARSTLEMLNSLSRKCPKALQESCAMSAAFGRAM